MTTTLTSPVVTAPCRTVSSEAATATSLSIAAAGPPPATPAAAVSAAAAAVPAVRLGSSTLEALGSGIQYQRVTTRASPHSPVCVVSIRPSAVTPPPSSVVATPADDSTSAVIANGT